MAPFSGSKIVLLSGERMLTYLRDDKPTIPYPAQWDLPGGGREGEETPLECALRETHEEFGLHIDPARVVWERHYTSVTTDGLGNWFFVAEVDGFDNIVFGDEGQHWTVMTVGEFLDHPEAFAHLKARLRDYLERD